LNSTASSIGALIQTPDTDLLRDRHAPFRLLPHSIPAAATLAGHPHLHEVMHPDGIETLTARMAGSPACHAQTTKEVGKAAAETDVKTLVLNHFVPGDDPAVTDEMWRADPSKVFGKLLFVGRDLQTM
jgi:hypothetical protein